MFARRGANMADAVVYVAAAAAAAAAAAGEPYSRSLTYAHLLTFTYTPSPTRTHTHAHTHTDTHRHTQTHRHTDTQTHRHTHTHTSHPFYHHIIPHPETPLPPSLPHTPTHPDLHIPPYTHTDIYTHSDDMHSASVASAAAVSDASRAPGPASRTARSSESGARRRSRAPPPPPSDLPVPPVHSLCAPVRAHAHTRGACARTQIFIGPRGSAHWAGTCSCQPALCRLATDWWTLRWAAARRRTRQARPALSRASPQAAPHPPSALIPAYRQGRRRSVTFGHHKPRLAARTPWCGWVPRARGAAWPRITHRTP